MMTKTPKNIVVRTMIEQDMDDVMAIEVGAFPHPWTRRDFRAIRRKDYGFRPLIATGPTGDVLGYIVISTTFHEAWIDNLAISRFARRQGIGSRLVEFARQELTKHRRSLLAEVSEKNLDAHLFFRDLGFIAIAVKGDAYESVDEASYLFEFRHGPAEAKARQR